MHVALLAANAITNPARDTAAAAAIAQATSLRELDLSGNLLTELPHALATLPKLEVGDGAMQLALADSKGCWKQQAVQGRAGRHQNMHLQHGAARQQCMRSLCA